MGNTLDKPLTDKETKHGTIDLTSFEIKNKDSNIDDKADLEYGVSCMQGWRTSMEDFYIIANDTNSLFGKKKSIHEKLSSLPVSVLAVLDGHGGSMAAKFVASEFCACLCRQEEFIQYLKNEEEQGCRIVQKKNKKKKRAKDKVYAPNKTSKNDGEMETLLKHAINRAFLELDKLFLEKIINVEEQSFKEEKQEKSRNTQTDDIQNDHNTQSNMYDVWDTGTTATIVILTPTLILCSNVGDSRAILCHRLSNTEDRQINIIPLSRDHKPNIPQEMDRIVKAGGEILNNGLIDGELAVSRGIGDFRFKDCDVLMRSDISSFSKETYSSSKVSAIPELIVHHRDALNDQFIVLASDGIWDVLSNDECVSIINDLFNEGEHNLGLLCEEVLDTCLKKGSRDNMAIIIIKMPGQMVGEGGGVRKRRAQRKTARYK